MAESKLHNLNIPQLRTVRWASCDLQTGASPLPAASHYLESLDKEHQSPLPSVLLFTKRGIACSVVDTPNGTLDSVLTSVVRGFFGSLDVEKALGEPIVEVFGKLLESLESAVARRNLTAEDLEACRGLIVWMQRNEAHILHIGSARAKIFNNQLRIKNIKSLDALGSYAFDAVVFQAEKKLRQRDKEKAAKEKAKDQEDGKPSPAQALRSAVFECSYESLPVQGNDRLVLMTAPVWLPEHVQAAFRAAHETMNREAACQAVWQALRVLGDTPEGKILIIDSVPHEADVDLNRDPTQNKFKSNASNSAPRPSTIARSGGVGKAIAAAALVGVAAVGLYFGLRKYILPQKHEERASFVGRVLSREERHAKSDSAQKALMGQPAADSAEHEAVIAVGATSFALESQFVLFDKLQKPVVPFFLRAPQMPDSTALDKYFQVSVDKVPPSDWMLRPDPSTSAKTGRYWIFFKKPLPAGVYPVQVVYQRDSVLIKRSTQLVVLSSDLKSLRALNATKCFYGERLGFNTRIFEELKRLLTLKTGDVRVHQGRFSVSCQLDDKQKETELAYDEPFTDGPCIQATIRKALVELVWTYKPTGESVVLAAKEVLPQQKPPEVVASNSFASLVEATGKQQVASNSRRIKNLATQTIRFLVKGIDILYDVPIDADPNQSCKPLKARIDNIEPAGAPRLDFDNPELTLRVAGLEGAQNVEEWTATRENLALVENEASVKYYDDGHYTVLVEVRGVPLKPQGEQRFLKGKLAMKVGAKLTNPISGKVGIYTETIFVPVNLEY
jgi:hypothetical protein